MNDAKIMRHSDLGPLHDLLCEACPETNGTKSIRLLAKACKYSSGGLYKVIRDGQITIPCAVAILKVANGRVRADDFVPFLDDTSSYFISELKK